VRLGSFIPSAVRATFSAPRQLPIRWRLAGGSALLTLAILCTFAVFVGILTADRIRGASAQGTRQVADDLAAQLRFRFDPLTLQVTDLDPPLDLIAVSEGVVIRIVDPRGRVVLQTPPGRALGPPRRQPSLKTEGYRIETRALRSVEDPSFVAYLQVAQPLARVEATVGRVQAVLVFGVLVGTVISLGAGLLIARRAMAPVAALTATTREIATTRDPARRVTRPAARDEVSELAGTLDEMLRALAASREESEAMLRRQREFVADASHELRTPLTSVLANLELLADTLDGEREETARSALRSTQRMRRLVADLLLLARADVGRAAPRAPTDVGQVLVEAASELEPVAGAHELTVEVERAPVEGARDELHRLALNLMENALRHTPAGTHVRAAVHHDEDTVTLTVEDDGPGIPPEVRDRVFERFVRGAGDRGGRSFGLGLSIVRAVAEAHGGTVALTSPTADGHGTRFTAILPALAEQRALVGSEV